VLGLLGIEPQHWLKEPMGIVRIVYQQVLGGNPLNIPTALQGPSLALFTIILYNIWVFAGYNAVVFLAGLGSIPGELYEAAEVDGAGRWSRFRNITLPLLSPTTFFLSMLSIIGTFKAFTHIYVLRRQAAGKEIDTMSVRIFNQLYAANDLAMAALAFGAVRDDPGADLANRLTGTGSMASTTATAHSPLRPRDHTLCPSRPAIHQFFRLLVYLILTPVPSCCMPFLWMVSTSLQHTGDIIRGRFVLTLPSA
jgi:ABC-type glycerol-3-phosphate transport system permease component